MRIVLTFIAVALVATLSAAWLAPLLVDWSAQRGFIERQLSETLGEPVSIAGPIDLKLLPTPYLTAGRVKIGPAVAGRAAALDCEGMRLQLTLGGLFGGQLRFDEVDLDRPILTLDGGAGVSPPRLGPGVGGLGDRVALDRLVVRGGRLNLIVDAGPPLTFADIEIDASASSLRGPYRGSGAFSTPRGERVQFQLASSGIADSELPIKAEFDWGADGPQATFEGKIALVSAAPVGYVGAVTVSGALPGLDAATPTPWRISGELTANHDSAVLDGMDLRLGPEERALTMSGSARADFTGELALAAKLTAKTLNIDSLLRRPGEDSAPPSRFLAWLRNSGSRLARLAGYPVRLDVDFSSPSAFLGAQTLDQLSLTLASRPGQPLEGRFETGLPGQSHVRLSGALELGAAAEFTGKVAAHVGDIGALKDWTTEGEPELASKLSALSDAFRYAGASATGDLAASSAGFSARNLTLTVDRSTLTGSVTYTTPVASERGRLYVALRSDALDIDAAPNLDASADWLQDFDLSLDLEASRLRIARVGQSTVDSGSLVLKAAKTGRTFSLDRLSVADLGGATIEASGATAPTGRWARLKLDADHLHDFAALVARVAPGRYSRMFVDRAEALSPAKATLEARRDGPPAAGPFPLDFLKAEGEVGQSRFSLKLSNAPAPVGAVAAELAVDAADGASLLRQLGAKPPAGPGGKARLAVSASGRWEAGFDARLEASLAGAALTWRGRFVPAPAAPDDRNLFGAATMKSDNLLPLFSMFGLAAPGAAPAAPADLGADFVLRGGEASLPRLSGTLAGAKIAGNLAWRWPPPVVDAAALEDDLALARSIAGDAPPPPPRISGELSLDRATSGALFSLALGAPAPIRAGAHWSEAPFAAALLEPPPLDVKLKIAALDLGDGAPAQNFAARLRMERSKFELDEIGMDVLGGRASGRLTLNRDGAVASLDGKVGLQSIVVNRPGVRGRLGASLSIASSGQSPASLVASLAGEGQLSLAGVSVVRLDPGALGRVVAKAQSPDASIDETNIAHSLALELDRQSLSIPDGAAPAAFNSGAVRVGPVEIPGPSGHALVSGDFDLRSLNLQIRAIFEEAHGGKFWSGSPPLATVLVRGALDAPARQIDVASLSAGLATQAIAREGDRIAALEADMRERASFNRRLKADRFLAGREAEIAAYEAEQARLKLEADRERVEASLLKAYEEQMKAKPAGSNPAIDGPAQTEPRASAKPPAQRAPASPSDPTATGLY